MDLLVLDFIFILISSQEMKRNVFYVLLLISSTVELQMVMQSRSLDEGCGLQKVFHVVVPQLFLQRCSMRPLLPSGFSEEDAEL